MFCRKCGSQVADGALFCVKCGAQIISPSTAVKNAPAPKKRPMIFAAGAIAAVVAAAAIAIGAIVVQFGDVSSGIDSVLATSAMASRENPSEPIWVATTETVYDVQGRPRSVKEYQRNKAGDVTSEKKHTTRTE